MINDYEYLKGIEDLLEHPKLDDHAKLFFIKMVIKNWNLEIKEKEKNVKFN